MRRRSLRGPVVSSQLRLRRSLPDCQRLLNPLAVFCWWQTWQALGLSCSPKVSAHLGVGNLVEFMAPRFKQQGVDDARHVAGNASAAFRGIGVMGVLHQRGCLAVLGVALQADLVGAVGKLQRIAIG